MSEKNNDQYLYSGLIRLHILHHAVRKPFFGLWMKEELEEHGYRISPGTLYPLLHGLEKKGLVKSKEEQDGQFTRKFYHATPKGRRALVEAQEKVAELYRELVKDTKVAKEK